MFMLDEVPDPVWNTSIGNSELPSPPATSRADSAMASATGLPMIPSSAFSNAAARFSRARARIEGGVDLLARNGEVIDGPLRLGLPLCGQRHPHIAHRVMLHPVAGYLDRPTLCCVFARSHLLQPSGASAPPTQPGDAGWFGPGAVWPGSGDGCGQSC